MIPAMAQQVLSLDSCRAMALRNNKQLGVAKLKQEVALNTRKAVKTKYLPKVDLLGGYEWTSQEVSLLKDSQKDMLRNLGTTATPLIGEKATDAPPAHLYGWCNYGSQPHGRDQREPVGSQH